MRTTSAFRRGSILGAGIAGRNEVVRVALYSHDTFGLGHLRRCLKVAWTLERRLKPVEGRIFTGSPWADRFPVPPGFQYVRLAPVIKTGPQEYRPRAARRSIDEVLRDRRESIEAGIDAFRPNLFFVDNVPTGLHGEALPALERVKSRRDCVTILTLRDVIDDEMVVRRQWERRGVREALDSLYDEFWVFGPQDSPVSSVLPAEVKHKAYYCGCLGADPFSPPVASPIDEASRRTEYHPLVLLTGGGGGDSRPLVEAYLEALRTFRPRALHRIVLGPDYPSPNQLDRRDLASLGAEIVGFDRALPAAMSDADVVVAMAGYNTVCEALALGCRLVLVPRIWPRREQWLRATALGEKGRAKVITPDELTPERLWQAVESVMSLPKPKPTRPTGEVRAAERAAQLLCGASQAV